MNTLSAMRVHTLERTQIVRKSLVETFRFFTDPRNLKRLTPEHLGFKFLEEPPREPTTSAPATGEGPCSES